MSEANKEIIRRLNEEVWHQGRLKVLDEIFAPDSVHRLTHFPDTRGPEGFRQLVTQLRSAFPDLRFSIDEMVAEGDQTVERWKFTGTHRGEFMGIAPTGKTVTITGTSTFRFGGGKIVEVWTDLDIFGLWKQLGMVTDPAVAEANKAVARRVLGELNSEGRLEAADEIYATDCVHRIPHLPESHGPEASKRLVAGFRNAFPDLRFTILSEIDEGDQVVIRWRMTGTHQRDWMGQAGTGKQVSDTGISIFQMAGGKVVESWCDWDALGHLQQLGAVPSLAGTAEVERNKAVARTLFQDILTEGNLALVDQTYAPDHVFHETQGIEIRGIENVRQYLALIRATFPDAHFTVEEQVATPDTVVTRFTLRGTQRGEWLGIPATGKTVTVRGISTIHMSGGKMMEAWSDWDALSVLQQLGTAPPLGQAEAASAVQPA